MNKKARRSAHSKEKHSRILTANKGIGSPVPENIMLGKTSMTDSARAHHPFQSGDIEIFFYFHRLNVRKELIE